VGNPNLGHEPESGREFWIGLVIWLAIFGFGAYYNLVLH
jgi:hypothetical protein